MARGNRVSKMWTVAWRSADGHEHHRTVPSEIEARTLLRREVERGGVPIGEPTELDDRWLARWRDAKGKDRKKPFATLTAAKEHLRIEDGKRQRGETDDPHGGRRLFADVAITVAAKRAGRRASTLARDDSLMRSLVLPTFGDMRIRDISESAVEVWVGELVARGCANATIRKGFQLLGVVMRHAVRKRWISRSPCEDVDLSELMPEDDHTEQRFLSAAEIGFLADAIDRRYRALVLTAGYTGARFGELAALRVGRVDFLHRRLRVEETLNEVRGRIVIGPPKTRKARRAISVPGFLVDLLAQEVEGKAGQDLVFTAPEGGPIRRNGFRRRFWIPAVRASVGEPLRFHDLRHSHAAMLIGEGVHPKVLAERLGHTSIRTTLDTYGHRLEGLDEYAADALDVMYHREGPAPETAAVIEIGGRS